MKILLGLFFVCVFACISFGQTTPAATNNAESALITELQTAQRSLLECYTNYYEKDNSADKVKNSFECQAAKTKALGEVYTKISKNPEAIKILLTQELGQSYENLVVRSNGSRSRNEADALLISQTALQRLIVIQNQRIIELLEKLLTKK